MDGRDGPNDEGRGSKPTPMREVVRDTGPKPARHSGKGSSTPSPELRRPSGRGQRERPKGPGGQGRPRGASGERESGRSAPTPAREVRDRRAEPTAVQDLPSREFTAEGVEWVARLSGRATTGSPSDPGAPLLHVTFYRASDPLVAVREALLPGDSLDHLFEADLNEVLASARVATSREQPPRPLSEPGHRESPR